MTGEETWMGWRYEREGDKVGKLGRETREGGREGVRHGRET